MDIGDGAVAKRKDVVRWAQEQARLLREGDFGRLDIEHIAVGSKTWAKPSSGSSPAGSAVLLAHLLKWRFQPQLRTKSWRARWTFSARARATYGGDSQLEGDAPDPEWQDDIWLDALERRHRRKPASIGPCSRRRLFPGRSNMS